MTWVLIGQQVCFQKEHMVRVYCALIRSVLEYAVPVWASLPECLNELLESVQKKAMKIIFPDHNYINALDIAGLDTLSVRRDLLVKKFTAKARNSEPEIPTPCDGKQGVIISADGASF